MMLAILEICNWFGVISQDADTQKNCNFAAVLIFASVIDVKMSEKERSSLGS